MKLIEKKSQRNGIIDDAEGYSRCLGICFQANEQKYFLVPYMTPSVSRRNTWLSLYTLLWKYNLKCLHSYTSVEKTIFCSITIIIVKERAKNTI